MDGYDLDDTLAEVNFKQAAFKSMESIFTDAPVIYKPEGAFVVITGRPAKSKAERTATENWLRKNMPGFRKIYYVTGSEKKVLEEKAGIIGRLNLASYTDNNPKALGAIRQLLPGVPLFLMQNGKRSPF
jgi:hypothetical protein